MRQADRLAAAKREQALNAGEAERLAAASGGRAWRHRERLAQREAERFREESEDEDYDLLQQDMGLYQGYHARVAYFLCVCFLSLFISV